MLPIETPIFVGGFVELFRVARIPIRAPAATRIARPTPTNGQLIRSLRGAPLVFAYWRPVRTFGAWTRRGGGGVRTFFATPTRVSGAQPRPGGEEIGDGGAFGDDRAVRQGLEERPPVSARSEAWVEGG